MLMFVCTWMVLKVLCTPQSGCILFEISIKRNVIAALAYVWCILYEFLLWRSWEARISLWRLCDCVCSCCLLSLAAFSVVRWCCFVGYFQNAFKQLLHKGLPHRALFLYLSRTRVRSHRSKEDCISFDQTKLNIRGKWNQNVICGKTHSQRVSRISSVSEIKYV